MSTSLTLNNQLGLVSESEVCELRNMKLGSLRNERARAKGPPFVKLGRSVKYPLAGLKAYIAANTIDPEKSRAPTLSNPHPRRQQRMTATEAADAP